MSSMDEKIYSPFTYLAGQSAVLFTLMQVPPDDFTKSLYIALAVNAAGLAMAGSSLILRTWADDVGSKSTIHNVLMFLSGLLLAVAVGAIFSYLSVIAMWIYVGVIVIMFIVWFVLVERSED